MINNISDTHSSRARLSAVLSVADQMVTIEDTAKALRLNRTEAAKTLSRWTKQGWLMRIKPGLYTPVPLDRTAKEAQQVLEDPWVIIPALFGPCYVGGWSAAEHWGFTEQIFNSICVFTTKTIRRKEQEHHGTSFFLKHMKPKAMFGLKVVWRNNIKVNIADKHRTILDMLDTPETGGGIEHVAACLKSYLADRESDMNQLVAYGDRLGNGAVFKRLGFLAETMGQKDLAAMCLERITTGNSKLDPAISSPRMAKKWNLRVPESWKKRKP